MPADRLPLGEAALLGLLACGLLAACSGDADDALADDLSVDTQAEGAAEAPALALGSARNLVIIVADTLRDDAVGPGPLGHADWPSATPAVDALVSRSARFAHTWSASSYTPGSVASYMSSTPVRTHGWNYALGRPETHRVIPPELVLLAEHLDAHGFETLGLSANPNLHADLGFRRGFDAWRHSGDEELLLDRALSDLAGWQEDERHLLYLHTMAPHLPWRPSAEARDRFELPPADVEHPDGLDTKTARALVKDGVPAELLERYYLASTYDGDLRIGGFLDALQASPHADETVVVFLSDHGEDFGEHVFSHFHGVWEVLLRVPLVVSGPGISPTSFDHPSQLIDMAPTVTRLLGLPRAESWQGGDLFAPEAGRLMVAQRDGSVAATPDGQRKLMVRAWGQPEARARATDLESDPGEESYRRTASLVAPLEAALDNWSAATPAYTESGAEAALDAAALDDQIEALKSIGYVE